ASARRPGHPGCRSGEEPASAGMGAPVPRPRVDGGDYLGLAAGPSEGLRLVIITRTPLRVSFAGGGTDLRAFYGRERGAVLSTAIDKYIYITVNRKFDDRIRASYSVTEMVDRASELRHELIREALRLVGIQGGIEITSISDVPSQGTGLGSSSSYTVGLLN